MFLPRKFGFGRWEEQFFHDLLEEPKELEDVFRPLGACRRRERHLLFLVQFAGTVVSLWRERCDPDAEATALASRHLVLREAVLDAILCWDEFIRRFLETAPEWIGRGRRDTPPGLLPHPRNLREHHDLNTGWQGDAATAFDRKWGRATQLGEPADMGEPARRLRDGDGVLPDAGLADRWRRLADEAEQRQFAREAEKYLE